jgi:hypothetical protein
VLTPPSILTIATRPFSDGRPSKRYIAPVFDYIISYTL